MACFSTIEPLTPFQRQQPPLQGPYQISDTTTRSCRSHRHVSS